MGRLERTNENYPPERNLAESIKRVRKTGEPAIVEPIAPDTVVHDLVSKKKKGFDGWHPGDVIKGKFQVSQIEKTDDVTLISEGKTSMEDKHVLAELSAADKKALHAIGVAEVDVVVEVNSGASHPQLPRKGAYTSRLLRIDEIEKPRDVSEIQGGEEVLVEGIVIRSDNYPKIDKNEKEPDIPQIPQAPPFNVYGFEGEMTFNESKEYAANHPYDAIPITVFDGTQIVNIRTMGKLLPVKDGEIEIMNPSVAEQKDKIQTRAIKPPDKNQLYLVSPETYLLQGSPERVEAYHEQRKAVTTKFEEMRDAGSPESLRQIFSQLVRASLYHTREGNIEMALTESEKKQFTEIIEEKIPNEDERPAIDITAERDPYGYAQKIEEKYHTDIYSMNKRDLITFCGEAAVGSDYKLIFDLAKYGLSEDMQEDILLGTIKQVYPQRIFQEEQDRATQQIYTRALGDLAYHKTPKSAEAFILMTQGLMDNPERLRDLADFEIGVDKWVSQMRLNVNSICYENKKMAEELYGPVVPNLQRLAHILEEQGYEYTPDQISQIIAKIQDP